jgi:AraC-like DNA-binding protein
VLLFQPPDILSFAYKQPVMQEDHVVLRQKEQQIPGSIEYSINRYKKYPHRNYEEAGMLAYHYKKNNSSESFLELRFCLTGHVYCRRNESECEQCKVNSSRICNEKMETLDVLIFRFSPVHLSQFLSPLKVSDTLANNILHFRHHSSFTKILPLCGRTRIVLEALLNQTYSGSLENIYINAHSQMLLLYSLECMVGEKEVESFSCKFLANEADREKISKAREILLSSIGEPITIKELSRKVAINECYLKKGFKELFGTTIFDFYQSQRMEHARYLLYEKGLSVTDVSLMLGYSSISHFSTAFKKHTGLKPCELLLR